LSCRYVCHRPSYLTAGTCRAIRECRRGNLPEAISEVLVKIIAGKWIRTCQAGAPLLIYECIPNKGGSYANV
jgi:hypothetical protein